MSDKSYKHITYGTGFRIECRLKTWKEKTFWEKVKFWKQYKTALHPITSEELCGIFNKLPTNLKYYVMDTIQHFDSLGKDAKKVLEGTFKYDDPDDEEGDE